MSLEKILLDEILPRVEKPSRYLGNELNTVRKPFRSGDIRFALAFPDLYDVGLSNLGILILYDILNRVDGVVAERTYAPGVDLEAQLRSRGLPIFSWETKTPLSEFDAIGFSIQYELAATNILTMLDLSGIPIRSEDREDQHPIIIAGGPCVYHPEPYARFIDAFVIGDGEEAVVGVANVVRETRGRPRHERLEALTEIPGVYVPLLYPMVRGGDGTWLPSPDGPRIKKAMIRNLNEQPFPTSYIVPFTQQVHDRVSMEVLRGCTQGCRFCQAGMTYRPVRERDLETVRKTLAETVRKTGYDEISLSSLSTCDYSKVNHLVENSVQDLTPKGVSVTLPSIRTDSFSVDLSEMVSTAKKSGITFAPEAASPRLRALIDKWIPDEELLNTTDSVFARGWNRVKLYFMIGHPTETDEDVEAIARLSLKVLERGRKHCPSAGVNVGVSTFVPKPFTPFQWERQIDMDETRHKQAILRRMMNVRGIKLRPHEAENSWLEGIVSRGDRSVGELFELAWKEGCRLDGWSEHFDFRKWERAVEKWGKDPSHFLRERDVNEPLPWDHINIFIEKKFLQRDLAKAKREMEEAALTADCRNGCHVCGVIHEDKQLCNTMIQTYKKGQKETEAWEPKPPPETIWEKPDVGRMRFRFTKDDRIRLLSHLELQNSMQRTLRRAEIPTGYSNGFSPHMKLAFGDALPVGLSSAGEYGDVRLRGEIDADAFVRQVNEVAPEGVRIVAATRVELNAPSLTSRMEAARYTASLDRLGLDVAAVQARVDEFHARTEWPVEKRVKKKRGDKIIRYDLKELVREIVVVDGADGPALDIVVGRRGGNLGRPKELLMALFDLDADGVLDVRVHKVDGYVDFSGELVSAGSGWSDGQRFDPYATRAREEASV
ncbi:MAG: B12-binding protein [Gemmatimonadota bacterium]|nr:MAG: B12-binding protein [Gemmatimonadota bacterium]